MIESEYIKKTDAMNIVKRTHGDYVAAWSEIRELPAVEIAKEKKLVAVCFQRYSILQLLWRKNGK